MNKILTAFALILASVVLPRVALSDSDVRSFESRPDYQRALASMKSSLNGCITANSGFAGNFNSAAPVTLSEQGFKIHFPIMEEDGPSYPDEVLASGQAMYSAVLGEMARITQANLAACNQKQTDDGATLAGGTGSDSFRRTASLAKASQK